MANQELVEELIAYYTRLLIVQYSGGQSKAQATVALIAQELLASGVYFDVQNAYNLISSTASDWDTPGEDWDSGGNWDSTEGLAIGAQLDVLGKYVGVNRFYSAIDLQNYFSMITCAEVASPPSSPPAFGLETCATFLNDYNYNGTLVCNDIVTSQNALSDADFLTLIQFMIICNNMNYSAQNIDNALFNTFGISLRAESNGNMSMTFFVVGVITTLINTVIFKGILPVPMGVGFLIVENLNNQTFAMMTCQQVSADAYSPYAGGFSTCADYATLAGQVLICSQITVG